MRVCDKEDCALETDVRCPICRQDVCQKHRVDITIGMKDGTGRWFFHACIPCAYRFRDKLVNILIVKDPGKQGEKG